MSRIFARNSERQIVQVNEGESATLTVTFKDVTNSVLNKLSIVTLKLTLVNDVGKAVINSRNSQTVRDANGGSLSDDGVLTMKLLPADNVIVNTPPDKLESHIAIFEWTWIDDELDENVGIQEVEILVKPKITPVVA